MNAIQGFFRKYHAVPAGESGPRWDAADLDSLLGWFEADMKDQGGEELRRRAIAVRLNEIIAELWQRVGRLYAECETLPAGSPTHNQLGRVLAALARHAGGLTVSVK